MDTRQLYGTYQPSSKSQMLNTVPLRPPGVSTVFSLEKKNGSFNSSPPEQNGCHFADDIFRCIFLNETFYILIKISLKFVPKGQIDNNPALV